MSDIEVSRGTSGNPILLEFVCGDGHANLALLFSGTNYGEIYHWTFDDCRFDDLLYQGEMNLHQNARGPTFRSTDGLTIRRSADFALEYVRSPDETLE